MPAGTVTVAVIWSSAGSDGSSVITTTRDGLSSATYTVPDTGSTASAAGS